MENKETFHYTYSADEQAQIKRIREKYTPPSQAENKLEALRKLDAKVTSRATTAALITGILGALTMGTGMSLIMTELGSALGLELSLILGLSLGLAGILLVCLAYPIYNRTLKRQREKAAPEIMRLTDELMK